MEYTVGVMTENKRYVVKGSDDFFLHIEDTTFTEDAHEGAIYNIYQVVRRLNEQEERIKKLEEENEQLKKKIGDIDDWKKFVDFGNDDFVLDDGKIFVKFARIFELIEDSDSLVGLETICGADLDYIVATYLEQA